MKKNQRKTINQDGYTYVMNYKKQTYHLKFFLEKDKR